MRLWVWGGQSLFIVNDEPRGVQDAIVDGGGMLVAIVDGGGGVLVAIVEGGGETPGRRLLTGGGGAMVAIVDGGGGIFILA